MINKLKKEYNRFITKQFKKQNSAYIKYLEEQTNKFELIYDLQFVEIWKDYYFQNKNLLENKFNHLTQNLDNKSIEAAYNMWNRAVHILPTKQYLNTQSIVINREQFFSNNEIIEQNVFNEISLLFKEKYLLPKHIHEVSVFGNHHGLKYLPENIVDRIKNKDILDIGAFVGDSALVLNEYNPKIIHCFEPVKSNYDLIQKTIEMNNLKNIITYNFGVGNKEGEIEIKGGGNVASLNQDIGASKDKSEKIKITTLDKFESENDLEIGLIKIDIEGFELECIQNSIETIKKHKPILLISIYHHPKDFFEIKPLLEKLDLGYKFLIRKTNPFSLVYETMLIAY